MPLLRLSSALRSARDSVRFWPPARPATTASTLLSPPPAPAVTAAWGEAVAAPALSRMPHSAPGAPKTEGPLSTVRPGAVGLGGAPAPAEGGGLADIKHLWGVLKVAGMGPGRHTVLLWLLAAAGAPGLAAAERASFTVDADSNSYNFLGFFGFEVRCARTCLGQTSARWVKVHCPLANRRTRTRGVVRQQPGPFLPQRSVSLQPGLLLMLFNAAPLPLLAALRGPWGGDAGAHAACTPSHAPVDLCVCRRQAGGTVDMSADLRSTPFNSSVYILACSPSQCNAVSGGIDRVAGTSPRLNLVGGGSVLLQAPCWHRLLGLLLAPFPRMCSLWMHCGRGG